MRHRRSFVGRRSSVGFNSPAFARLFDMYRKFTAVAIALGVGGLPHCNAFTIRPLEARNGRLAAVKAKTSDSWSNVPEFERDDDFTMMTRRATIARTAAAILGTGVFASPEGSMAFPNRISDKYSDRPKQRGSKPKGLGVAERKDLAGEDYLGLKPCGAAPNCFCSTDSVEDSPDTNIPPFKWPDQLSSREAAFQQLLEVVKAYQPGQAGIDGGGFDVVTYDPKSGYLYVQFESLKNGFIDDLELASVNDGKDSNLVQVRSSSRLGYLDYGVNAKRINFISKALRAKGWDAPGVSLETHRGYAEENGISAF
ncbi:hypothetical protein ACHAWF_003302 [Thalassiosira exigua]